ncbi:hypothetical protein ACHAWF_016164 [Thalassiosira exigua]
MGDVDGCGGGGATRRSGTDFGVDFGEGVGVGFRRYRRASTLESAASTSTSTHSARSSSRGRGRGAAAAARRPTLRELSLRGVSVPSSWPTKHAPLRDALLRLLADERVAGHRCRVDQLVGPLNDLARCGDDVDSVGRAFGRDGGEGEGGEEAVVAAIAAAVVDEDLVDKAFGRCRLDFCVPYADLDVAEGGDGVLFGFGRASSSRGRRRGRAWRGGSGDGGSRTGGSGKAATGGATAEEKGEGEGSAHEAEAIPTFGCFGSDIDGYLSSDLPPPGDGPGGRGGGVGHPLDDWDDIRDVVHVPVEVRARLRDYLRERRRRRDRHEERRRARRRRDGGRRKGRRRKRGRERERDGGEREGGRAPPPPPAAVEPSSSPLRSAEANPTPALPPRTVDGGDVPAGPPRPSSPSPPMPPVPPLVPEDEGDSKNATQSDDRSNPLDGSRKSQDDENDGVDTSNSNRSATFESWFDRGGPKGSWFDDPQEEEEGGRSDDDLGEHGVDRPDRDRRGGDGEDEDDFDEDEREDAFPDAFESELLSAARVVGPPPRSLRSSAAATPKKFQPHKFDHRPLLFSVRNDGEDDDDGASEPDDDDGASEDDVELDGVEVPRRWRRRDSDDDGGSRPYGDEGPDAADLSRRRRRRRGSGSPAARSEVEAGPGEADERGAECEGGGTMISDDPKAEPFRRKGSSDSIFSVSEADVSAVEAAIGAEFPERWSSCAPTVGGGGTGEGAAADPRRTPRRDDGPRGADGRASDGGSSATRGPEASAAAGLGEGNERGSDAEDGGSSASEGISVPSEAGLGEAGERGLDAEDGGDPSDDRAEAEPLGWEGSADDSEGAPGSSGCEGRSAVRSAEEAEAALGTAGEQGAENEEGGEISDGPAEAELFGRDGSVDDSDGASVASGSGDVSAVRSMEAEAGLVASDGQGAENGDGDEIPDDPAEAEPFGRNGSVVGSEEASGSSVSEDVSEVRSMEAEVGLNTADERGADAKEGNDAIESGRDGSVDDSDSASVPSSSEDVPAVRSMEAEAGINTADDRGADTEDGGGISDAQKAEPFGCEGSADGLERASAPSSFEVAPAVRSPETEAGLAEVDAREALESSVPAPRSLAQATATSEESVTRRPAEESDAPRSPASESAPKAVPPLASTLDGHDGRPRPSADGREILRRNKPKANLLSREISALSLGVDRMYGECPSPHEDENSGEPLENVDRFQFFTKMSGVDLALSGSERQLLEVEHQGVTSLDAEEKKGCDDDEASEASSTGPRRPILKSILSELSLGVDGMYGDETGVNGEPLHLGEESSLLSGPATQRKEELGTGAFGSELTSNLALRGVAKDMFNCGNVFIVKTKMGTNQMGIPAANDSAMVPAKDLLQDNGRRQLSQRQGRINEAISSSLVSDLSLGGAEKVLMQVERADSFSSSNGGSGSVSSDSGSERGSEVSSSSDDSDSLPPPSREMLIFNRRDSRSTIVSTLSSGGVSLLIGKDMDANKGQGIKLIRSKELSGEKEARTCGVIKQQGQPTAQPVSESTDAGGGADGHFANERSSRFALLQTRFGGLWNKRSSSSKAEVAPGKEEEPPPPTCGQSIKKEVDGATYFRRGKRKANKSQFLEALARYNLALVRQREELGENHLACGTTLHEIGVCWMMLGDRQPALTAFEEALYIRQQELGDGAMEVVETTNKIWTILVEEREKNDASCDQ